MLGGICMSIAEQLDFFIKSNGDNVFIEAEGRPARLGRFYAEYNSRYSPSINDFSEGIIVLDENANKWGLELRLYMHYSPSFIHATSNRQYRKEYEYRINDKDVIGELFDLGYRIGEN